MLASRCVASFRLPSHFSPSILTQHRAFQRSMSDFEIDDKMSDSGSEVYVPGPKKVRWHLNSSRRVRRWVNNMSRQRPLLSLLKRKLSPNHQVWQLRRNQQKSLRISMGMALSLWMLILCRTRTVVAMRNYPEDH